MHKLIPIYFIATFITSLQTGNAADPRHTISVKTNNSPVQSNPIDTIKNYSSSAQSQLDKLLNNNHTDTHPITNKLPAQNQDIGKSITNKMADLAKGLVYDPKNSAQYFDYLIAGYSFLVEVEKQCIPYGEKIMGSKNQLIISSKENYNEQLKYLNALKQQKLLFEQSKLNK